MKQSELNASVMPALLVGTKRKQIPYSELFANAIDPGDPKAGLKALCLMGQSLRFARSVPASDYKATSPLPSDRIFLPEQLRKIFVNLVAGAENENIALMAARIARTMESVRVAPHPFDWESAGKFMASHASQLGAMAYEWAQSQKPDAISQEYFDWSALDDATWIKAPTGQRERFLRERRQADPNAARALLEADWPNNDAEIRLRLLACLWVGLAIDDREFLASLAKDRAPKVREAASAMLNRLVPSEISGSLKTFLGRVKSGQAGVLRKRKTFVLEYPANVKEAARLQWILDNFGELSLEMIAKGLDCGIDELLEAAGKDEGMLFALLLAANNGKRLDFLAHIVQALPDAWERLANTDFAELPEYTPGELQQWIETVVRPQSWHAQTEWLAARRLYSLCGGEALPPKLFDAWLRSSWAKVSLAGQGHYQYRAVELIALLCPSGQRKNLEKLIRTDDDETQPVRWFIELLNSLEALQHG